MVFRYSSPSGLIHDPSEAPHQAPSISSSSRSPRNAHVCPEAGPKLEAWGIQPWSQRKVSQNHSFLTIYMEKIFIQGEPRPFVSYVHWRQQLELLSHHVSKDNSHCNWWQRIGPTANSLLPLHQRLCRKCNTEYNAVSGHHTRFPIRWFNQNTFIFMLSGKD